MGHRTPFSKWLAAILLTAVVHFQTAAPAAAQCIMCYMGASGSGARGIRAIQIGILILMIPTVAIMTGLVYTVIRRRHARPVGNEKSEMDSTWDESMADLGVSPEADGFSPRA